MPSVPAPARALPTEELYLSSEGAALYEAMATADTSEVRELTRVLRGVDGPILDLACGSGRLSLPLLANRHEVVALDNSPAMLHELGARLRGPCGAQMAARLTVVQSDMTAFALDRRFGAIVLGATSVSLLDQRGRAALFACVRRHLAPDGRFLVSALALAPVAVEAGRTSATAQLVSLADRTVLCTIVERLDPVRRTREIAILRQEVGAEGLENAVLFVTSVHVVAPDALERELAEHGLHVRARHAVAGGAAGRSTVLFEAAAAAQRRAA